MKYILFLIPVLLCGCFGPRSQTASSPGATNAAPDHERALRLLAALGTTEAVIEDAKNSVVLQEVSDALNVFCGSGPLDSLFLIQLINGLPERLNISEKTRLRVAAVGLLLEELGGEIKPADYVTWGGVGCAIREGIHRGIALAKGTNTPPANP